MEEVAHIFSFKAAKHSRLNYRKFSIFNFLAKFRSLSIGKVSMHILMLIIILLIASFLRLYRISEYMTFLGDEGRDVLVAKYILEGDFTLLGPRSSAADFFYGPVYYYLITPFLWLFQYDPVGPAVMVALFGIATVYLTYKAGSIFFNETAGLIAAFLYAISPLVIAYSRSSWNPNPLPFFSLLIVYLLYKAVMQSSGKLFLVVGILLGIVMQLQYLSIFLFIIVVLYVLIGTILIIKNNWIATTFYRYFIIVIGFLVGMFPFLAFEIRHGFPNTRTILNYIFIDTPQKTYVANGSFFSVLYDVFFRLYARLVANFPPPEQINVGENLYLRLWQIGIIIFATSSIVILCRMKNRLQQLIIIFWIGIGIFLFGFYKKQIYDYYFGFLFPIPFLLIGNLILSIYKDFVFKIGKILAIAAFLSLVWINLQGIPFRSEPNRQKDQAKEIAEFVLAKTNNKPFNFALLTLGNSDHGYRYFFELYNRRPVPIENEKNDPQRKTVAEQLLIVCEDPQCKPLGNPLWEVAGFGRAEIVGHWNLSVVQVYKLTHYKGMQ